MLKDYFKKLKTLFFEPKKFFETVSEEKDYMPILIFFLIAYVIYSIIGFISKIPSTPKNFLLIITLISSLISAGIMGFAIPFVSSAINHLGVLIFGGKQNFFNTFKPSTYAAVISIIYGLFLTIILFILNLISPTKDITEALEAGTFSWAMIPIPQIIFGLLILLISIIHLVYTEVIGISKFQKMTKTKALFAVLFIPVIFFVGLALLAIIMFFIIGYFTFI